MTMALTLLLTGSPLGRSDRWQIQVWIGDTQYVNHHASVQGTKFSPELSGPPLDAPEAVRSFILPIPEEVRAVFPRVVFEGYAKPTNEQVALEELMAKTARAGIEMFIEWLRNNPDIAVRQQFADTLTRETLTASFL